MPSPGSNPASRRQLDVTLRAESMSDADLPAGTFGREESTACLADDPNCHMDSFTKRWRSMQHVNGVAVYVEVAPDADPLEGESRMMSVPVACTPEACFRVGTTDCTEESRATQPLQAIMRHGFDNWTTLTTVDAHTSVLYQRRPAGLVTAARDCVLLRTWRRDVDGSYIILLQDTEHAGAPPPGNGLLGGTVRAHVRPHVPRRACITHRNPSPGASGRVYHRTVRPRVRAARALHRVPGDRHGQGGPGRLALPPMLAGALAGGLLPGRAHHQRVAAAARHQGHHAARFGACCCENKGCMLRPCMLSHAPHKHTTGGAGSVSAQAV